MAATRFPGKPLALIAGEPMIVQVWRRAIEAGLGRVVVAAADREIAEAVRAAGGEAVMTRADHASGSDRVFEAMSRIDADAQAVLNLQGDLPTIAPQTMAAVIEALERGHDIATAVAEAKSAEEQSSPNVVKAVVAWDAAERFGRALYFTRARAPSGDGPLWHHIGIYAYRPEALARFVALPPSPLERREKPEQLRALEADMTIGVARVETVPWGVDTPEDLARAEAFLSKPH
jgi:3-deoxy-manno-octulosonate cytidylyltransferase (CMP-KDO synthetase)